MQAAGLNVVVPEHFEMNDTDLLYLQNIIGENPKVDWTPYFITRACELAMWHTDLNEIENELREEGRVIFTAGGNQSANPRNAIAKTISTQIKDWEKSLGLDIRSKGDKRDVAKRKKKSLDVQDKASVTEEDLIARPH